MNNLLIAGHVVADVDPSQSRFTASGIKVTTVRVACNSRKGGKEETMWWRVTLWGDRFDKLIPYLKKGAAVIITGEMKNPEIYTNKEGQPTISLEMTAETIRFSPFGKPERQEQGAGSHAAHGSSQGYNPAGYAAANSYSQTGYSGINAPFQGTPQVTSGQSMQSSHSDEEEMPF
jgi:single-strand DNA-binding protein